jgi:hypothetical protein
MMTIHLMNIEALDKSYRIGKINDLRLDSLKFLIFQFRVMIRRRCCIEKKKMFVYKMVQMFSPS